MTGITPAINPRGKAMSECIFKKGERVIVPANIAGAEGVQAVIIEVSTAIGREPYYGLEWPSNDTVRESDRTLKPCYGSTLESGLVAAQPPKMITKADADDLVQKAYRAGADDLRAELEMERVHRAAARKRKPAGKAKPKSKRNR